MPSNYIITEPAPSSTTYMRSGRGGAGNTYRGTPITTTGSAAPSTVSVSSRRFFTGVGGAGNVHQANERPAMSIDDEVRRLAREELSSAGHTGIGGAGNVYRRKASDASDSSAADEDARSSMSAASSSKKLWARVSSSFARD
jgi:hypothetical protein